MGRTSSIWQPTRLSELIDSAGWKQIVLCSFGLAFQLWLNTYVFSLREALLENTQRALGSAATCNNRVRRSRLPGAPQLFPSTLGLIINYLDLLWTRARVAWSAQRCHTQQIDDFYTKSTFISFRGKAIKTLPRGCDWQEIPVDLAYYCWWGSREANVHVPGLVGWNCSQCPIDSLIHHHMRSCAFLLERDRFRCVCRLCVTAVSH